MNTYFELTISFAISMALSLANQVDWQNDNPNVATILWDNSYGLTQDELFRQTQRIIERELGKVEWDTIWSVMQKMEIETADSPHTNETVYRIKL